MCRESREILATSRGAKRAAVAAQIRPQVPLRSEVPGLAYDFFRSEK
jgi:hypothetical protein